MRLVFGVLSLVVVVAAVALLARTQLQAVQGPAAAQAGASAAPAQQVQRKVADDVNRLMQQAPARQDNGGY